MTRWKPKHTKEEVIEFFLGSSIVDGEPVWNRTLRSTRIAETLGCSPEYVRATLARAGYQLKKSSKKMGKSLCGINQKKARARNRRKKSSKKRVRSLQKKAG